MTSGGSFAMHSPVLQNVYQMLGQRLQTRTARIAVIGLGYVGLPLATQFARAGFAVTGLDVDEDRISQVNHGVSYIQDVEAVQMSSLVEDGGLCATTDFTKLAEMDVLIICVPTPLDKLKKPDISYIVSAAEHITQHLRPGQLIVLESTTYPGTTDEILLPMFERSGLKLDQDFFLAFSPERIDPGNRDYRTENIPKLVGGVSPLSTALGVILYQTMTTQVHPVSSARTAETAKLLENTFRSVNIALVNELAQLCRILGINVWEVVEAAGTKPFGFMKFYPGPGVGGHCIPLDPSYLTWKARAHGYEPRFIEMAEEVNTQMPRYVVDLVAEALNSQCKSIKGSKVLILGVAYKPDIDDYRESPALRVMQQLHRKGAILQYSDPYVPRLPFSANGQSYLMHSYDLDAELLQSSDCVVITTDHGAFPWPLVAECSPLVVDTRNALGYLQKDPRIFRL
jgi:UDP-N-acetyl-D-glucosamine dehydrogenase